MALLSEVSIFMRDHSFTARLALLIGIDTVITIVDSFVPQDWTPVRLAFAILQLGFMTITMIVAGRRVLQDY